MPYYVDTSPAVLAGRGELQPSARLSFAGAVGSAVTGNASSVIADYAELQQANQGPRLTQDAANQLFKDAGVKHSAPADGYTQSAVDVIVKRQRNQMLAREIDAATPYSWLGTPVRGGAMLLAGLADPLNVASAFMPVVREARVASILANAGESALARAGARAAIGAAEGFAGAAALELPTYGLRTAMQDDYHLTDSLLNMAFGTALGGGLHAVGGAIAGSQAWAPRKSARCWTTRPASSRTPRASQICSAALRGWASATPCRWLWLSSACCSRQSASGWRLSAKPPSRGCTT
jgi:hypothetical protein